MFTRVSLKRIRFGRDSRCKSVKASSTYGILKKEKEEEERKKKKKRANENSVPVTVETARGIRMSINILSIVTGRFLPTTIEHT